MRMSIAALLLCAAVACQPTPPPPPAPVQSATVAASFGKTWDAAIDVFTQNNIPIRNMERASGLLVAEPTDVRSGAGAYADCGGDGIGGRRVPTHAFYNVVVRGDSSTSTVRVSARWTLNLGNLSTIECATKATFESGMEATIKARAEGRPTPMTAANSYETCATKTNAAPSGGGWVVTVFRVDSTDGTCWQRRQCTYKDSAAGMTEAAAIEKCRKEDEQASRLTPP